MDHNDCGEVCHISATTPGDLIALKVRDQISFAFVLEELTSNGEKTVALIEPGHPAYNGSVAIYRSASRGNGIVFKYRNPFVTYDIGQSNLTWHNYNEKLKKPLLVGGDFVALECGKDEYETTYFNLSDGKELELDLGNMFVVKSWSVNCHDKHGDIREIFKITQ